MSLKQQLLNRLQQQKQPLNLKNGQTNVDLGFAVLIRKVDGKTKNIKNRQAFYDILENLIRKCWCCKDFCKFYQMKIKIVESFTLSDWFDLHSLNEKCPFKVHYPCPSSGLHSHHHMSQRGRKNCKYEADNDNLLDDRFSFLETKYSNIQSTPNAQLCTTSGLQIPMRTYDNLR